MKVLKMKSRILVVNQNQDGSLLITHNNKPIDNAGSFIVSLGGIEAVLARCTECTEEEFASVELLRRLKEKEKKDRAAASARQKQERAKVIEMAYKEAFGGQDAAETTISNIRLLLRYLNTMNWGMWQLPKMTVGYKCCQYDCDGKVATTITLDRPIDYEGEMVTKFKTPSPRGHLRDYCTLR